MKAVMISIRPRWCELISKGEKTVEVRKTRPKIDTPFKCYIYETKGKTEIPTFVDEEGHEIYEGRGQVIGEFVCDEVLEYLYIDDGYSSGGDYITITRDGYIKMCLNHDELLTYGDGKTLYGWHISDLVIYDEPKELSEFMKAEYNYGKIHLPPSKLYRPPQSWCYVEESEVEE